MGKPTRLGLSAALCHELHVNTHYMALTGDTNHFGKESCKEVPNAIELNLGDIPE